MGTTGCGSLVYGVYNCHNFEGKAGLSPLLFAVIHPSNVVLMDPVLVYHSWIFTHHYQLGSVSHGIAPRMQPVWADKF